ncbi:hypothetical protein IWX78_003163 [Mycetocola sp. CAN_C7]
MRDKPSAGPPAISTTSIISLPIRPRSCCTNTGGLLGECFEEYDDDDMMGRGWLIDGWRDLIEATG